MSKEDYIALAGAIRGVRKDSACDHALSGPQRTAAVAAVGMAALSVAAVLAADNPRFNHDQFMAACGYPA